MATGPSYRVPFRRRRQGKTDYQQRRGLVLSRLPRFVVRGSLRSFTAQLTKAEVDGDKVLASADSGELVKNYGWLGDPGSISAAYLVGLLCGLKAASQGVKETVLDIGLQHPSKGARVFAALKGAVDSGLTIPFDKRKLPDDKRIMGHHIAEYARQLATNPEAYQKQFSAHLARGLKPEETVSHFGQVKEKIVSSLKGARPSQENAQAESSDKDLKKGSSKKQEAKKKQRRKNNAI